jgi:N-acetylglucosamine malate deacetylase 2
VSQPPSLLAALRAGEPDQPLPRSAVVVAHPDDESVGAGSRLCRLARAQFVYVTGGAPADARDAASHGLSSDAYAAVRWRESMTALAVCGIGPEQVLNLRYADQGAALRLPQLARALAHLFAAMGTQAVLTHAYEGGHPDHDATAFAVRAAAAVLRCSGQPAPDIVEMASYHMGPQGIRAGAFLPHPDVDGEVAIIHLSGEEQRRKRALFDCYATQRQTLAYFPLDVECFRPSPHYDFRQPPHEGKLFYECQPWGMTASRFCSLAVQAMAELALEGRM